MGATFVVVLAVVSGVLQGTRLRRLDEHEPLEQERRAAR